MLHLIKLCVGVSCVRDLRKRQRAAGGEPCHVTRLRPRRYAEILDGGSIYWVIAGNIAARQRIRNIELLHDAHGTSRCRLVFARRLIAVHPVKHRPFQGWRYFAPVKVPLDITASNKHLPPKLFAALDSQGVIV